MSAATDATSETPMHTVPPAAATKTRPFFWSVRRELWENHAIWIAPLVVAAIVIFVDRDKPAGYSSHADWFMGWDAATVNTFTTK